MSESGSAFRDVARRPRGHLSLLLHTAAYFLIYDLRCRAEGSGETLDDVLREYPFLNGYFQQVRSRLPQDIEWLASLDWLESEIEAWERAADSALPLIQMRRTLDVSLHSVFVFVLAGMVEEETHFGMLFEAIGKSRGTRRLTAGLAQQIFDGIGETDSWQVVRPLVDAGFLEIPNPEAPRADWILRVPQPLWNLVRGEPAASPLPGVLRHECESLPSLHDLVLDPKVRDRVLELHRLADGGRAEAILLRGMPGTDRLGIAGALARQLGRGILEIEAAPSAAQSWRLIGPLSTLSHAIPVFSVDAAPGETFDIPTLAGFRGPVIVLMGREGGIGGRSAAHALTLQLDLESPSDRLELWKRALNGQAPADLSTIASLCLPGRYIGQCARLALDYAAMDGAACVSLAAVRQASRALNRQVLDTLATRIDGPAAWSHLIVREPALRELQVLEGRCRHRERLALAFDAGIPGGMNRGVRALFEGASGTGKTLAARVLASELGLDLYRVDLAAVVNKYIGETEKNLSRVLARAEDLNVVLLLDEGDALMTRRTDVKSSNDRYANLETNYLLQRLESYTGIVIVTTNAGQSIDPAFRRRMDAVIKFDLPDAADRWRLWQAHLPSGHTIDALALEEASVRHQFTGGQIRNISIRAMHLALSRSSATPGVEDFQEAIQAEHRKAGTSFSGQASPSPARNGHSLAAFLGGLS